MTRAELDQVWYAVKFAMAAEYRQRGWLPPGERSGMDAEVDRLRAAILRIDAINDNPAHFSSEINAVCDGILRPHLASAVPSDQRQTGEA